MSRGRKRLRAPGKEQFFESVGKQNKRRADEAKKIADRRKPNVGNG